MIPEPVFFFSKLLVYISLTSIKLFTEGNKKTEERLPHFEEDIRSLVDSYSQADPDFRSPFIDTRVTAKRPCFRGLLRLTGYAILLKN